jgi:diguanylate cyclase (GGDEF)-like protein
MFQDFPLPNVAFGMADSGGSATPMPSRQQLLSEIDLLHQQVEQLCSEKTDLEIIVETITEHADSIEAELRTSYREIGRLCRELAITNKQLERLAHSDALTGLANRRRFNEYLEQEWQNLCRREKPLALILCDVDFFKLYNDAYGHQAGDECLKQVAHALQASVKRSTDVAARYGGEEMAVVLPNTDRVGAMALAEAIRNNVRDLKLQHVGSKVSEYVTLSLGVACQIPTRWVSSEILIADADAALYEAKRTGRDRTVLSPKTLSAKISEVGSLGA